MADTTEDDILTAVDPVLADKKLRIAFGRNMRDMNFVTENLTLRRLIEREFNGHKVGPKDGRCLLQGDCVTGQRVAKNMRTNYLVIVDVDTGETPSVVADKVEAAGLFAVVSTTHSNGKTVSDFAEDKFLRWCMKRYDNTDFQDDTDLLFRAQKYMQEESKYTFEIADSATHAEIRLDDNGGGKKLFVTHDPMPRLRLVFVLDEPFSFEVGVQSARIAEWKERYAGFCVRLGLPFDRSCVDPSRLMFTPRVGSIGALDDATFWVLPGRALTLDDMPRFDASKRQTSEEENAFTAAADELEARVGERKKYVTKGLAKFAAVYAKSFNVTGLFEHYGVEARDVNGTHHTYECPNDEAHSNAGDPNDKGFFVVDAENNDNGFSMFCSHDSCRTMYNNDRMLFLDKACQNLSIVDARELLQFCPGHEHDNIEDEIAEETAELEGGFETLLLGLTKDTDPKTINLVLKTLVKMGLSAIEEDRHLASISKATKVTKGVINSTFKEYKREEVAATSDEGNEVAVDHPVPEGAEAERANTIWGHWPFSEQKRVALAAFKVKNARDPRVFSRAEGGTVRLTTLGLKMLLEEMATREDWTYEIDKHLSFRAADEEQDVPMSPPVIGHFIGSNELGLPLIERVVNVPVFGEDGSLRTEKGYHEASQSYLNPNIAFRSVPDVVTEDDLAEALYWLHEAVRDFPFSDSFTGYDPLPVRVEGEVDDEGFPIPNMGRGKSSRANYFALMLQPFARAFINGPCPAYLLDKSMPGTGAGFLADVAGYTLYGHRMTPQTVAEDKEEFRKEITATLREGAATIFLDNINHKMDHGPLASALTSGNWKGRLLGQSTNIDVPVRATWIFAANSGRFSEELMRRIVPIRMDAATPNPSRDRPVGWYKHPDLHGWLDEHREDLVWACHILIKNWLQAGSPDGKHMLQSFNSWARTMGGILECAGIEGFLDNVPNYLDERLDDEDDKTAFIERLFVHFKIGDEFTTDDAMLAAGDPMNPERLDPALGFSTTIKDARMALGRHLSDMVGKTYRAPNVTGLVGMERKTGKGRKKYFKLVLVKNTP